MPGSLSSHHARARRATKAQGEHLQQMLDMQAAAVEGMLGDEIKALAPLLRQARGELARELAAWAKGLKQGSGWDAQVKRNALAMLNRVDAAVADILEPGMQQTLERAGARAAKMSAANVNHELAAFSGAFEGSIHPISIAEAGVVASGRRALFPRFASSAARYAGAVGADIRKQIALGFLRNETFEQMTRRLVKLGGPTGRVALVGIDGMPGAHVEEIAKGLFKKHEWFAERLVRTEGINAYNVVHERGLVEAHREDPEFQQRWDASADRRRCPLCRDLDGQVVNIGELFRAQGDSYQHPPAHPCCRCTLTPWKAAWAAYGIAKAVAPPDESVRHHEHAPAPKETPKTPAPTAAAARKPSVLRQPPGALPPQPKGQAKYPGTDWPLTTHLEGPTPVVKAPPLVSIPAAPPTTPPPVVSVPAWSPPAPGPGDNPGTIEPKPAKTPRARKPKPEPVAVNFTLPVPPALPISPSQAAAYKREAYGAVASSRASWQRSQAIQATMQPSTTTAPGLTYSAAEFRAIRTAEVAKLKATEFDAALFYSHKGDRLLNRALRTDALAGDKKLQATARSLDRAINRYKLPAVTYVTRGVQGEWATDLAEALQPGHVFQDKGYTSTSATKPFPGEVRMRIKLPKGQAAGPIPTRYANPFGDKDEDEFLLPRGTKFRCTGKTKRPDGSYDIELEVVK